ncbi:uncharacterized protein LOC125942305 isoform X2 [Dermacentor silvarum]|uniref:uncharacterized protein LOC125942305 isoform X2 n=1 Tax=Dermacentor silvarum TaxID=543639 RepID=UPI002101CC67|nr:uncharacterized protein LOC125942305 isoform X2 [Dermacentor silvarum]
MDKSHGSCDCCKQWYQKHITLKRKIAERSLQISKFQQLEQENNKLRDELREMQESSQTLRADCAGYKKATLGQYKALVEQLQEEAKGKAQTRPHDAFTAVSRLEKKLQACTQQAKQARSQHKKAMGWLRGFHKLLRHPESWTSKELQLQVEHLATLVHAEESSDEDLQRDARQLEALLRDYETSTQELTTEDLTTEDLIARAREMQIPNPISPLPPSPPSHCMLVPDPVPFVSSYSTLLSASSEPEPPTPSPELRPSAVPSDHMLLAPSSEQMLLECPSQLVPAEPLYVNTQSELVPAALLSEPVLPTVLHNTAQMKSLGSVSLLPHLEQLQQGPPLEPLLPTCSSDMIPQATLSTSTPLAPMSDPVRLTQHSESAPPVSVESEPTSLIVLSEPASPASSLEPKSLLAPPASSLELESLSAPPASSSRGPRRSRPSREHRLPAWMRYYTK